MEGKGQDINDSNKEECITGVIFFYDFTAQGKKLSGKNEELDAIIKNWNDEQLKLKSEGKLKFEPIKMLLISKHGIIITR